MRCSCIKCGEYMVQKEQGMKSGCVCPNCLNVCRMCMGSETAVKSREELQEEYLRRLQNTVLPDDNYDNE